MIYIYIYTHTYIRPIRRAAAAAPRGGLRPLEVGAALRAAQDRGGAGLGRREVAEVVLYICVYIYI